ncbi:MAG: hypothetical protein AAB510_03045 [Patescibacteria group bacterium]
MNIKFLKIKKVFKKHSSNIKPEFYWQIMVYIVFILSIFSFLFGYQLFKEVSKEADIQINSQNKQEIVKKARLEKVLDYFEAREKRSDEIVASPSPIIDPSL